MHWEHFCNIHISYDWLNIDSVPFLMVASSVWRTIKNDVVVPDVKPIIDSSYFCLRFRSCPMSVLITFIFEPFFGEFRGVEIVTHALAVFSCESGIVTTIFSLYYAFSEFTPL